MTHPPERCPSQPLRPRALTCARTIQEEAARWAIVADRVRTFDTRDDRPRPFDVLGMTCRMLGTLAFVSVSLASDVPAAVERALADRCTGSMRSLRTATVSEVRDAASQAIATRHGAIASGHYRREVGELSGVALSYDVWIPESYEGGALPVLVRPAHPTDPPDARYYVGPDDPYATLLLRGANLVRAADPDRYDAEARWRVNDDEIVRVAIEQIADALIEFPLDPDRLVCTGTSASGNWCWSVAARAPRLFAGIWPKSSGRRLDLDPLRANLRYTPVRAQAGSADPIVDPRMVSHQASILRSLGGDPDIVMVLGAGHDAYNVRAEDEGIAWFLDQRRPPAPNVLDLAADANGTDLGWVRARTENGVAVVHAVRDGHATSIDADTGVRVELELKPDTPVRVRVGGRDRTLRASEDPVGFLEDVCRTGDPSNAWSARVRLVVR
jgi:poly(3-hydroxybutyrate) depolymerase